VQTGKREMEKGQVFGKLEGPEGGPISQERTARASLEEFAAVKH